MSVAGFGVAYFENESAININALISEINGLFNHYQKTHAETRFIIELGRYLVAESGYLIASVQSVKKSHEKNYLVVDAGMHCYLAVTGLGSFVHRNFPAQLISRTKKNSNEKINYQVAGPLCTPGDILLRDIALPTVKRNDLLVISNAGAYGLTASPGKFLSHGCPAEVILDGEKLHCIRRRETAEDILATQLSLITQNGEHYV